MKMHLVVISVNHVLESLPLQLTASSGRAVAPGGPADTRWRPPPPHHAAESGSGRSSGASGATGHESRAQGHLTHPAGGPSNTAPPRSDPGPGSGHSSGRPHPPLTRATPPAPALATDGIRGSAPAPPARLSGSGSGAARAQAGAVPGQPAPLPLAPVFTRNAGGPAGPSGLGPLVTVELMLAAGERGWHCKSCVYGRMQDDDGLSDPPTVVCIGEQGSQMSRAMSLTPNRALPCRPAPRRWPPGCQVRLPRRGAVPVPGLGGSVGRRLAHVDVAVRF